MSDTEIVKDMLKDLNEHKRSKEYLDTYYVKKRLDRSLEVYYEELMASYRVLMRSNTERALKKMIRGDSRK